MPRFTVRADPNEDLYMQWSSVVDAFTFTGTREKALRQVGGMTEKALKAADDNGTTSFRGKGGWSSPGLTIMSDTRNDAWSHFLPREHFLQYARLLQAGRNQEADALLIAAIPQD